MSEIGNASSGLTFEQRLCGYPIEAASLRIFPYRSGHITNRVAAIDFYSLVSLHSRISELEISEHQDIWRDSRRCYPQLKAKKLFALLDFLAVPFRNENRRLPISSIREVG